MKACVRLYGDLVAFGDEVFYEVSTPYEVIKAVDANYPGFTDKLGQGEYAMFMGDEPVTEESRLKRLPDSGSCLIHVFPVPTGHDPATLTWAVIGEAILDAVILLAVAYTVNFAISYLFPPEEADNGEKNKPSYHFNGPVNTMSQGNPVAICYGGPLLVGSQVISSAISAEDIALDFTPE